MVAIQEVRHVFLWRCVARALVWEIWKKEIAESSKISITPSICFVTLYKLSLLRGVLEIGNSLYLYPCSFRSFFYFFF